MRWIVGIGLKVTTQDKSKYFSRYYKIFSRLGLRQQPGGERRARRAGGAGRQLLVAEHGAGAADPHPEQPRQGHPREGVQHAAGGGNII